MEPEAYADRHSLVRSLVSTLTYQNQYLFYAN